MQTYNIWSCIHVASILATYMNVDISSVEVHQFRAQKFCDAKMIAQDIHEFLEVCDFWMPDQCLF